MPSDSSPHMPDDLDDLDEPDQAEPGDRDIRHEAEREDAHLRRWERIGTERIQAYAEAIGAIGEVLYPPPMPDETTRRRRRIDPVVRGELELAMKAMAADIKRLASQTGPKMGGDED